ncbi:MAG: diacylglycerol kinase family protein [Clostridia bacterium]|nr:diacylglycerol kinase family protein [Clostridia bacterium]
MKYHILFNKIAGNGKCGEKIEELKTKYSEKGECLCTEISEITDYVAFFEALGEEDAVILCGGDGTINCFVNNTDGIDIRCDVLYYATGTGNDFLHDIGKEPGCEPFSIKKYIKDLPIVEVNGKTYRFINNVGFGIDGYCCEVGDAMKAQGKTDINYTSIAIKGLLFHYKPTGATVTVDGQSHHYKRVWIAPTMKGRFYGGGMMPAPKQDRLAEDGRLSVMLMHNSGKLPTLIAFPSLFKGELTEKKKVAALHEGYDITVTFDRPSTVQIDGETILGVTSYRAYAKKPAAVKVEA